MEKGRREQLVRIGWLLLSEVGRKVGRWRADEERLRGVWGPEYRDDVQTLRTWISRLRYKLEKGSDESSLIRTIPKTGYIMDLPQA